MIFKIFFCKTKLNSLTEIKLVFLKKSYLFVKKKLFNKVEIGETEKLRGMFCCTKRYFNNKDEKLCFCWKLKFKEREVFCEIPVLKVFLFFDQKDWLLTEKLVKKGLNCLINFFFIKNNNLK